MESNRDEAEKCIQIAAQAFRESKLEKAEKFLKKADKLYPSQKAKGTFSALTFDLRLITRVNIFLMLVFVLDLLEKVLASAKDNSNESETIPDGSGDTTRRRKSAASPSRKPQSTEPDYTPDQLQHVKRIQR